MSCNTITISMTAMKVLTRFLVSNSKFS